VREGELAAESPPAADPPPRRRRRTTSDQRRPPSNPCCGLRERVGARAVAGCIPPLCTFRNGVQFSFIDARNRTELFTATTGGTARKLPCCTLQLHSGEQGNGPCWRPGQTGRSVSSCVYSTYILYICTHARNLDVAGGRGLERCVVPPASLLDLVIPHPSALPTPQASAYSIRPLVRTTVPWARYIHTCSARPRVGGQWRRLHCKQTAAGRTHRTSPRKSASECQAAPS